MNRRHHPQVIRAKEMARAAGLDPYARIQHSHDSWRSEPTYSRFMDAAFDEHFEREAVDNIWWDRGGSFYTDQWNTPRRDGECRISYGRCKSGRRWFWCVSGWVQGQTDVGSLQEYGWADTEDQALLDGTAAIKRLAAGRRVIAGYSHGTASYALKVINAKKRKARPPSDATDSTTVEYLYGYTYGGEETAGHPVRFRIIKKTAKRVYYLLNEEQIDQHGHPVEHDFIRSTSDTDVRIGFVDRQKLEATAEVYNRGRHWCYADFHLHASLEGLLGAYRRYQSQPVEDDLRKLKAEMAAAHPDRGGSSAAFIAARQAYVAARHRLHEQQGGAP